jgi:hypothetical protein
MVRPERFELPTYCSGGLTARIINTLAAFVSVAIRLRKRGFMRSALPNNERHTSGHWAQNWAHYNLKK